MSAYDMPDATPYEEQGQELAAARSYIEELEAVVALARTVREQWRSGGHMNGAVMELHGALVDLDEAP